MRKVRFTLLGFAIVAVNWACVAQDTKIPFKQLESSSQLMATLTVPDPPPGTNPPSSGSSSSLAPVDPFYASIVIRPPAAPLRPVSPNYLALNGLHLGLALLDVQLTQHCIADHHCVEGNPLMPSSRSGQLSIDFAYVGYSAFVSYRLRKQNKAHLWWISPVTGIAAHALGVASGLGHY
jgi:hypothetical protein